MSVGLPIDPAVSVGDLSPQVVSVRPLDSRAAWRAWGTLIVVIGGIYLLMFNPYWAPGGDSEFYIAVGRSWANQGLHYFNGQRVGISPPGWPLVLAGAMKISPTFAFLRIITITCMTFALGFWFWFLLRFMNIGRAVFYTMLTAIISHIYTMTFWMHSEAMFCLLATAAMVVAAQINERRTHPIFRIILLGLLCAAASMVRWTAPLQWLLIGGILARGHPLPFNRTMRKQFFSGITALPWTAILVSFMFTLGTFGVTYHKLQMTPQEKQDAQESGGILEEQTSAEAKSVDLFASKPEKTTLLQEKIKCVRESGRWFSWFLWPELRFVGGGGVKYLSSIDTILGWLLILPLAYRCWLQARSREWMWLGLLVYCVILCLRWPNPNARYLVPIGPLIIWGMVDGIGALGQRFGRTKLARTTITGLLGSAAIANLILLAVDVRVARASNFYALYDSGLDQSMISAIRYLNGRGLADNELGVSEIYNNFSKPRASKAGLRAAVMLSDRIVKNVPSKYGNNVARSKFTNWARSHRLRWFLMQDPISPWRVWHFRIPGWLQRMLSREDVAPESAGWKLYRFVPPVNVVIPLPVAHVLTVVPGKWIEVRVPASHGWPTRVPGME